LDHTEHGVQDDDGHDRTGLYRLPQQERDSSGGNQDDHEEAVELDQQQLPETRPGPLSQLVGPIFGQAGIDLGRRKPGRRICTQRLSHLLNGTTMPFDRYCLHTPLVAVVES
jgi:hypothetical protein